MDYNNKVMYPYVCVFLCRVGSRLVTQERKFYACNIVEIIDSAYGYKEKYFPMFDSVELISVYKDV